VLTHGALGVSTPAVVTPGATPAPIATNGRIVVRAGIAPTPAPTAQARVADRAPGGSLGPVAPAPDVTVVPTATPVPVAASTAVPYVASDDPPQIVNFWISATTVHPGDVLSGGVTASSNVASVEVRVAGYSYLMTKTAPGRFELSATVPSVPRIFRRTYPLVAIARNTRGDATQRATQITIR
ncbi:MAG: hypothetical protein M3R30_08770, partial [Candidatus Eremiobacteraeota bacterium]|nr:hypothetical protein [Candidatus Eremiobacteraeota bacterium]